jgi:hypothetical protein
MRSLFNTEKNDLEMALDLVLKRTFKPGCSRLTEGIVTDN